MSNNMMWFGNRNYMQWVACPRVGASYGSQGSTQSSQYLSGGAMHRQSFTAAKTFQLSWTMAPASTVRAITDYVEGVYDSGFIYWSDPFTMDQNVLPQSFATPSLGAHDGSILDGSDTRPTLVQTDANPNGYPTMTAVYDVAASAKVRKFYVPIPPGHAAWVGVHGATSAGGVMVQPTVGTGPSGAEVRIPVAAVTDQLFSDTFPATGEQAGIELSLEKGKMIALSGVVVQVLPVGKTPRPSPRFISGQGASGCSFNGYPSKEAYSAALDLIGLSAEFIETEQWT